MPAGQRTRTSVLPKPPDRALVPRLLAQHPQPPAEGAAGLGSLCPRCVRAHPKLAFARAGGAGRWATKLAFASSRDLLAAARLRNSISRYSMHAVSQSRYSMHAVSQQQQPVACDEEPQRPHSRNRFLNTSIIAPES